MKFDPQPEVRNTLTVYESRVLFIMKGFQPVLDQSVHHGIFTVFVYNLSS
jgi:hypothetical protein